MKETKKRSITKAVTYRMAATVATFSLALIFTGSLEIATSIGILDFIVKFTIYYLNERVWTLVSWGYKKEEVLKNKKSVQHATTNPQPTDPLKFTFYTLRY